MKDIWKESDIIDASALDKEEYWKPIGKGGFSEVYLTNYFGSNVAVKKYSSQDFNFESPQFRKEFRALK